MRIRHRILFSMIVLILFSLGIVGTASYYQARRSLLKLEEDYLSGLATEGAHRVEMLVEEGAGLGDKRIQALLKNFDEDHFKRKGLTGYAYIMDGKGVLIYHPNSVGTSLAGESYGREMLQKREGIVRYIWKGRPKTVGFRPVEGTDWIFAVGNYDAEFMGTVFLVRNVALGVGIGALILSILASLWLALGIARPLERLQALMQRAGEGDLSVRAEAGKGKDEIARLGEGFNAMLARIGDLVRVVAESAQKVAASSDQLRLGTEQAAKAAEQITMSIQEVSSGALNQARHVDEAADMVGQITTAIRQVSASTGQVSAEAGVMARQAGEGRSSMEKMVRQMTEIGNTVGDTARMINLVGDKAQSVGEIINLITGIADQTNLLALNAAIEAARAGEQGRGFAVVAEEVRKLAEQCRDATEQISSLIQEMQEAVQGAVTSMERGTRVVEEGAAVVGKGGEVFEEILGSIESVTGKIAEVTAAAEQMAASADQVMRAVEEIARIAAQNSSAAQQVAAATEQETSSLEELSSASEALAQLAASLRELTVRFQF